MIFGKYINRYYLRFLHLILLGAAALIVVDYAQLRIPEYEGIIVDSLSEKAMTLELLEELMFKFLLIALAMFIGRFLWRITIFGTGVRVEADLRDRMFAHSEKLSQNYFHKNKVGAQMALYTNDLNAIRLAFSMGILTLVDALFMGSLALYYMFKINVMLTLLLSIPMFLMALAGGIIGKFMRVKFQERQKAFENLSDFTQENFSGLSVIKAFVKEGKELLSFRKINKENAEKNVVFLRYANLLYVIILVTINLIGFILIGVGSYLIIKTKSTNPEIGFTVGDLTRFISYFSSLIWPMMAISQLINLRSQGKASYKRIKTLFDEPIDIVDNNPVQVKVLRGEITYRNFNFAYPDTDRSVLKDINLEIKPGESVGIIGRTGCGKTTLVDVLLRLYNLEESTLFIDGIDIMRLPIKQVRDLFGYVPQDNFLFSDTIHNNIAFAHESLPEDEVKHYASLADVAGNIEEFSQKYQTVLGERGVTVSGGQKQRISIARALAKDPKVLILDDSISAVDSKTEETILSNLQEFKKDRTIILIAHRVSSIQNLDKIVFMDNGRILGVGTHEELMENVKLYQDLVQLQELEEQVEVVKGDEHGE
ncbi:MAG: ABC transporter ATP-binding protein [Bacilli bacterium]|jgi:ATP-binding cassette subfamily B multidrug efflux pump|nr:ABC transporter ATP-binding protein [Bacilli bacterium]HHU23581.1 ABC transporter ATP-binding protein [Acholeplasmataceae bacterium]